MLKKPKIKFKNTATDVNNRLHFLMAVIFLLILYLLVKLFFVQVIQGGYYKEVAMNQHQASSKLVALRGRILMQNSRDTNNDLFPLATNKEFGDVYAVPMEIDDVAGTVENLYQLFNRNKIEIEVDGLLANNKLFATTTPEYVALDEIGKAEYRKFQRSKAIEERKKMVVDEYSVKVNKGDDPYESIQKKVDEEILKKIDELKMPGIHYDMTSYRYYPEREEGSQLVGFVGLRNDHEAGFYGLEGFFDEELTGKGGIVKAEKAATGEIVILSDREYQKPENGNDLVLTISRAIQHFTCEKLAEHALRHGADAGSAIVMDPKTGAIIAMCSWPEFDPNNYQETDDKYLYNNQAIFGTYEPGSVFKVFTMAAGLDTGKITPQSTYVDKGAVMIAGWNKPISNSDYKTFGAHGLVDMNVVLQNSLNTGTIHIMNRTGVKIFTQYVKNFGFGEKTGIELETEGYTNINNLLSDKVKPIEAATASFGQGITVTPLQLAAGYAAIANGGVLMKPYVVDEIRTTGGRVVKTDPREVRRVITEKTAMVLSGMMVEVVEKGHAKRAQIPGYYVAGKTGTAQMVDKKTGAYGRATIHTFGAFVPADEPRFVILTKLDDPKDVQFAESSAVPLWREIAEFALNYYQVPKEREEKK